MRETLTNNAHRKDSEPRGNTLRVYLFVLRHAPCELRDVQHGLGMASPSLASYHLSKLIEGGYVKQDAFGKYVSVGDAAPELLAGYSKLGATVVPQSLFFSLLLTILVAFFGIESLSQSSLTPYLVGVAVAAVAALWFETFRLWRKLATWK